MLVVQRLSFSEKENGHVISSCFFYNLLGLIASL